MIQLVRWTLLSIHVLAGAAWFGAMLYSLLVLHPRARAFFADARKFEEFIAGLAAGARWKVLGLAALIALTGLGLLFRPFTGQRSAVFDGCIYAKIILLMVAIVLFCFTSWRLWPARVMASPEETPKFQRKFRFIAVMLISLVGIDMVLGIIGSHWSGSQ